MLKRKITRTVNVGGIAIGGGNPIVIQSMCNTDTRDIDATVKQITELANEGCQIVRVAVVDMEAAKAIGEIFLFRLSPTYISITVLLLRQWNRALTK